MSQARFYLPAIVLHLAALLWLASPVPRPAFGMNEVNEKYIEVTLNEAVPLQTTETSLPDPAVGPPMMVYELHTFSEISNDQAGEQMTYEAIPSEPLPIFNPDLAPPETPQTATPESAAPALHPAPVIPAPPGAKPSPFGANEKKSPGPVPKIKSLVGSFANGVGKSTSGALPHGPPACRPPEFEGHRYMLVAATSGFTWREAQDIAAAGGGHLATIRSPAENKFLFSLINQPYFWKKAANGTDVWGPWIGGYKSGPKWQWLNKEGELLYNNWADGQSDLATIMRGGIHFFGKNTHAAQATWGAANIEEKMPGFIVEFDSKPSPATPTYVIAGLPAKR